MNIYKILGGLQKMLRRNENRNGTDRSFKLRQTRDKAARCLRAVFTRPPPNARPIGLYPAHSWVPGREIGADGEG
jgi:hypothetical protein